MLFKLRCIFSVSCRWKELIACYFQVREIYCTCYKHDITSDDGYKQAFLLLKVCEYCNNDDQERFLDY